MSVCFYFSQYCDISWSVTQFFSCIVISPNWFCFVSSSTATYLSNKIWCRIIFGPARTKGPSLLTCRTLRIRLCWTWVQDQESCLSLLFRPVHEKCTLLKLVQWRNMLRWACIALWHDIHIIYLYIYVHF